MKIKGIDGLSDEALDLEISQGGRFVCYDYCMSILIMTFRRSSDIYFIRNGSSALAPGLKYTLLSLVVGWWGIPWGPIFTIGSVAKNLAGGRDVTEAVRAAVDATGTTQASLGTSPS